MAPGTLGTKPEVLAAPSYDLAGSLLLLLDPRGLPQGAFALMVPTPAPDIQWFISSLPSSSGSNVTSSVMPTLIQTLSCLPPTTRRLPSPCPPSPANFPQHLLPACGVIPYR